MLLHEALRLLCLLLGHGECQTGGSQQHPCGDCSADDIHQSHLLGAPPGISVPPGSNIPSSPSVSPNGQGLRNPAGEPALPQKVRLEEGLNSCTPGVVWISQGGLGRSSRPGDPAGTGAAIPV